MFHYSKNAYGYYVLEGGEKPLYMPEVAVCYSEMKDDMPVFLKHGRREEVEDWAQRAKATFIKEGQQKMADDIKVLVSDAWKTEDLNRILDTTGYIGVLLKKPGFLQSLRPVPLSRLPDGSWGTSKDL